MIHEQGGDTTSGEQPEAGALFSTVTEKGPPPDAGTGNGPRLLKLHAPTATEVVVDELVDDVVDELVEVVVVETGILVVVVVAPGTVVVVAAMDVVAG